MIDPQVIRAFEEEMTAHGLIVPSGGVIPDGAIHRCNAIGPGGAVGKGDGAYRLYGDPPVAGWYQNWHQSAEPHTWKWNGTGRRPTEAERAEWAERQRMREAAKAKEQEAAAGEARRRWESAKPADPSHPYLTEKKIPGEGLRQDGNGNLLVPMQDSTGTIRNVERIFPDGSKRFQLEAATGGLFFVLGPEGEPDDPVVIVEGAADAIAVFRSTGRRVYAAMSSGNLPEVGRSVRREHPEARIVYFADHDKEQPQTRKRPGIEKANEAAAATGARVVMSPVEGEDPCDVYARGGGEAVREILDAAIAPATAIDGAKFPEGVRPVRPLFESLDDALQKPILPVWMVKGLIEMPSTGCIFGSSGAGKTFVAGDFAGAVATGGTWMGRKITTPGLVFYLVGEGRPGLLRRFQAWQFHHGVTIPKDRLYISTQRIELDEKGAKAVKAEVEHISSAVGTPPSLVVIDTLARALPGGASENDPKDMASFINVVDDIRNAFGCVCLVVHHSGHTEKDRSRGHSSFRAALDFELRISRRGQDIHVAEWTKLKDLSDDVPPQEFTLKPVSIEATEDGELVRSAVVSWKGAAAAKTTASTTKAEDLGLSTLKDAIRTCNGFNTAPLEEWRKTFYRDHVGDNTNAKKQAFRRVREALATKGLVVVNNDEYTLPPGRVGAGT